LSNVIEITHSNYMELNWDEHVSYQYRGLKVTCDHEYDAGTYMVWLDLPSGPNYIFNTNKNGDLPYIHEYMAGYMSGEPDFASALEGLMKYVDEYYKYIEPYIK